MTCCTIVLWHHHLMTSPINYFCATWSFDFPPWIMRWTVILGVLFCLGLSSSSFSTAHPRYKLSRTNYARIALARRHGSLTSAPKNTYSVKYFQQRVDHFNAADDRTFKQRYLVNQENWDEKGPILLYTGNEGDITWFCNNTVCTFNWYCMPV